MEVHLVSEALKFMILGMGVVFLFLYLLVQLMKLQAYIINRYFENKNSIASVIKPKRDKDDLDPQTVAAIMGAIMEYKKSKSRG